MPINRRARTDRRLPAARWDSLVVVIVVPIIIVVIIPVVIVPIIVIPVVVIDHDRGSGLDGLTFR
ncbi:hypothetical protein GCM10022249_24370 [Enteractinococcus coprophilus]